MRIEIAAFRGGELDGARWFTTDRDHAANFGAVVAVVLSSGVEPARIDAEDLDLPVGGGYAADAVLIDYMDEIDCAWAVVSNWEGAGDCVVIREPQYVHVEEAATNEPALGQVVAGLGLWSKL